MRKVVMYDDLAYFCFGYAFGLSTVMCWCWMAARERKRQERSRPRGRAYWDAILLEDQRKRETGESYEL